MNLKNYTHLIQPIFMVKVILINDGTQNCLVFQPTHRYFKRVSNTNNHILWWKSKGLSDEIIKYPSTPDNSLNPLLNYVGTKIRVEFKGSCLKQDKISFDYGKVVNISIVYEINKSYNISSFLTLENCLFGAVELPKHPDIDQYKYSGYGIVFYRIGFFSLGNEIGRNVMVFVVDMSSSPHIDNKKYIC